MSAPETYGLHGWMGDPATIAGFKAAVEAALPGLPGGAWILPPAGAAPGGLAAGFVGFLVCLHPAAHDALPPPPPGAHALDGAVAGALQSVLSAAPSPAPGAP